jgi:ribosomal-protein-alanine N-acetyltransferase
LPLYLGMEIHLRAYTPADKAECLAAFMSNVPLYFTREEIGQFEGFLDKFQKPDGKLENGTHYFVVALGDQVVGCGGFGYKENTDILFMAWGLVHNDYHKIGLGKALLLHRVDMIKRNFPGSAIGLDTTQHSYPFFEKMGFRVTKITEDFYEPGMHRYDMVFMES